MRTLTAFLHISLDGYFANSDGGMDWAHSGSDDETWRAFVAANARSANALVFGRVTYAMMAGFWPTPMARKFDPTLAKRMNSAPKIVFSRTLESADWSHTALVRSDPADYLGVLKATEGPDLTILGSGSLVAQLVPSGVVDELQIVVNPIVLGSGRALMRDIAAPVGLTLVGSRVFGNGKVLLRYTSGADA